VHASSQHSPIRYASQPVCSDSLIKQLSRSGPVVACSVLCVLAEHPGKTQELWSYRGYNATNLTTLCEDNPVRIPCLPAKRLETDVQTDVRCVRASRCTSRPQPIQGRNNTHSPHKPKHAAHLQEEVCCMQVRQLHCSHVGVSTAHGTQQGLAVAGLHTPNGKRKGAAAATG